MHFLYLDDSGSAQNKADNHIILAGVSVFERQTHWLSGAMDRIAADVWPDNPNIELHAQEMFSGKRRWRGIEKDVRVRAYGDALRILKVNTHVRLFGAVIHRRAVGIDDPMEFAFEALASRFDRMLGRMHKAGDTQRGLIVLDKSSYETSLQALAIKFRTDGHRWGTLRNLAEVPLFVDSQATRMIQYADLVAYALRRYYERGDATYFDIIRDKFDALGGVVTGLLHHIPVDEACGCHVCGRRP